VLTDPSSSLKTHLGVEQIHQFGAFDTLVPPRVSRKLTHCVVIRWRNTLTAAAARANAPIGRNPAPGSDCRIGVRTPFEVK